MAYATGTASTGNILKPASISNRIDELDPVIDRAANYADRLQKILDRLTGPMPSAVSEDKPDTPPHGVLDAINRRRERLVDIMNNLEQTVSGLENSI